MTDDNIFEDLPDDEAEETLEETPELVNYVAVRSPGGNTTLVEGVTEPTTIRDVMSLGHITVGSDTAFFVESVSVAADFRVGPGATVQLVNLQKGG